MKPEEKPDLDILYKIYCYVIEECRKRKLNFSFKVDSGNFETRIDVFQDGTWYMGNGKLPMIGTEMFCPDIIDFHNKKIIEYEEEAKPNSGYFRAKKNKGHTEYPNTRDERRDKYYQAAKFDVLKIWENDIISGQWMMKIDRFLGFGSLLF